MKDSWNRGFVVSAWAILLTATAWPDIAAAGPGDRVTRYTFPVSSSDDDRHADVAVSDDGSFAVAWLRDLGIVVRRFNADGSPRGPEFLVAEAAPPEIRLDGAQIAIARDGRFVVVWSMRERHPSGSPLAYSVRARLFDATGVPRGDEFVVGAPSGLRSFGGGQVVMGSASGRFVILSRAGMWPLEARLFARAYNADGTPITDLIDVTETPVLAGTIAADSVGNVVVAWTNRTPGNQTPPALNARRLSFDGDLGTPFVVARGTPDQLIRFDFGLAMGPTGAWVIAYGNESTLYARRFGKGAPAPEFVVARYQTDGISHVGAAINAVGEYVFTWVHHPLYSGPRLQRRLYSEAGVPLTAYEAIRFGDPDHQYGPRYPVVGMDAESNFVVVFERPFISDPGAWIQGQLFAGAKDARPSCQSFVATLVGTAGADSITGGLEADIITGLDGADTIDGGDGSDVICGRGDGDVIFGGPGHDLITGGWGDDVIDGGDGYDVCYGDGHFNSDTAVQCESVSGVP